MADYSALWTSSRDPEFQQIKKVKQLTERHLAMHVSEIEKTHKRHMKKTRDQIRDNMVTLEKLEQEKEKRARHILATYIKHQRVKEAATLWSNRAKNRGALRTDGTPTSGGGFLKLINQISAGTPDSRDSLSSGRRDSKITLPQLHVEGHVTQPVDDDYLSRQAIQRVEQINNPSAELSFLSPLEKNKRRKHKLGQNESLMSFLPLDKERQDKYSRKPSVHSTQRKRISFNGLDSGKTESQKGRASVPQLPDSLLRKSSIRQKLKSPKVYMTHTFPYVYHSEGEKPCPRYGLFRECTDYDPYFRSQAERKLSKMASSRKTSMATDLSQVEHPGKKASLFSKVGLAVKLIRVMHGQ